MLGNGPSTRQQGSRWSGPNSQICNDIVRGVDQQVVAASVASSSISGARPHRDYRLVLVLRYRHESSHGNRRAIPNEISFLIRDDGCALRNGEIDWAVEDIARGQ